MHFTLTGRKQLAAIFIGASLVAGCSPQEKTRQQIISDEVHARLGVLTEAQKPYWTSAEYEQQKLVDKCSAENIALYQYQVEKMIDIELPKLVAAKTITPETAEHATQDLHGRLAMQSLTVMMACQQGSIIPDVILDRKPN